jgi:hypothetical protein
MIPEIEPHESRQFGIFVFFIKWYIILPETYQEYDKGNICSMNECFNKNSV